MAIQEHHIMLEQDTLGTHKVLSNVYTVDSPLTDAPKSRHMPNNGQWSMYQLKILYYNTFKTPE